MVIQIRFVATILCLVCLTAALSGCIDSVQFDPDNGSFSAKLNQSNQVQVQSSNETAVVENVNETSQTEVQETLNENATEENESFVSDVVNSSDEMYIENATVLNESFVNLSDPV